MLAEEAHFYSPAEPTQRTRRVGKRWEGHSGARDGCGRGGQLEVKRGAGEQGNNVASYAGPI